jgi:hypothetical protein
MTIRAFFAILALASASTATEQTNLRCPVEVRGQGDDRTGNMLVYQVKEGFRRSASFCDAGPNEPHVVLVISTMDYHTGEKDMEGLATIYCAIWLYSRTDSVAPSYVDNVVGYCGAKRLSEFADGLVASTDRTFGSWTWLRR